jgi:RimJ/RimL family protein N-acetyltransferase
LAATCSRAFPDWVRRSDMSETLESERLRFRKFRESDFPSLLAVHNDPLTKSVYGEMSPGDVWRRIAMGLGHWQLRGFGPFALEHKDAGRYVGACGLWFPEGWQDIEIGYSIAPEFRKQSYASEAVRRVREHGYKDRGFTKLVSYIQPSNIGSQAVAKSVGAIADGEFDMAGKSHIIFVHPKT